MIFFLPLINLLFYFQTINFKIIFPILTAGIIFTLVLALYIKYKYNYVPFHLVSSGFNVFLFVAWTRNVTSASYFEFSGWDFILLCTVIVLYSIEFSIFKIWLLGGHSLYFLNSTSIMVSVFSLIAFILSINSMLSFWFSLMVLLVGGLFGLLKKDNFIINNKQSSIGYKELVVLYCFVVTIFILNELFINYPLLVNYNVGAFLALFLDFNFECIPDRSAIAPDSEKQIVLVTRKGKALVPTSTAEAPSQTRKPSNYKSSIVNPH